MILITDMESGERVFLQDASDNSLFQEIAGLSLACPAAQAEVSAQQMQQYVMPALMEHTFGVKR